MTQEARTDVESIVETVRESLLILGADLRLKMANRSFYRAFQASPKETENKLIDELGNGQWNIPRLRGSLAEILPRIPSLRTLMYNTRTGIFPQFDRNG